MDAVPANNDKNTLSDTVTETADLAATCPAAPEEPKKRSFLRSVFHVAATPFRLMDRADKAIEKKIHGFAERHPRLTNTFNTVAGIGLIAVIGAGIAANPAAPLYAVGYLAATFGMAALGLAGVIGAVKLKRAIFGPKGKKAATAPEKPETPDAPQGAVTFTPRTQRPA